MQRLASCNRPVLKIYWLLASSLFKEVVVFLPPPVVALSFVYTYARKAATHKGVCSISAQSLLQCTLDKGKCFQVPRLKTRW